MSTKSNVPGKLTAAFAIVFLLPPVILFMIWSSIGLRFSDMNQSDKIDTYMSYFHGIFKNIHSLQVISIICCLVAIVLASKSFKKHLLSLRVLMLLTVLIGIFIILFDISQIV